MILVGQAGSDPKRLAAVFAMAAAVLALTWLALRLASPLGRVLRRTGANVVTVFNVAEAKARFSELVRKALSGEEVVIARDNKPILKLVPLERARVRERSPGVRKREGVDRAGLRPAPGGLRRLRPMQLLLDTQVFLWWVEDAPRLSRRARRAIAEPGNDCWLSLASCWEMAIKVSLGKLRLRSPLERFVPEQLARTAFAFEVDLGDVSRVARLPFHHRDPFDRLLVAQALEQGLAMVTANSVVAEYGVKRIW